MIRIALVKENWIEKFKITKDENNLESCCLIQAGSDKGPNQSSNQKWKWESMDVRRRNQYIWVFDCMPWRVNC